MEWMISFFILCMILSSIFLYYHISKDRRPYDIDQLIIIYKTEIQKQKELLLRQEKEINQVEKRISKYQKKRKKKK